MTCGKVTAPGWPGIEPRWTSSAKTGVGTALGDRSPLWFTISHGIINEVYYPRIDCACTRDLGLIATDGADYFSEEKRDADSTVAWIADGVPGFRLVNTCRQGRYRIEKTVLSDPKRSVLLQKVRFVPLRGSLPDYRVYVLLAPHLGNQGYGNTAWIGSYDGVRMPCAARKGIALALACSAGFTAQSAGYVGFSDGWLDLKANRRLTHEYDCAENGNVAITAEVDLAASTGEFLVALGFGNDPDAAARAALESLAADFSGIERDFTSAWRSWLNGIKLPQGSGAKRRSFPSWSASVLRVHESKQIPGAIIAGLSIPWGEAKGDNDMGGYHLVWPRDLVETASALLAIGAGADVLRVMGYLADTQSEDGHWNQNMWADGSPYWNNIQLDETAFPILLADLALRERVMTEGDLMRFWPMVYRAACFIASTGPVTAQDRWEEDPGYSPFTIAVSIAALLAAADMAERYGAASLAPYLCDIADFWNGSIERWCYVRGTDLCDITGVEGYYVRVAPPNAATAPSPLTGYVPIKNRPPGQSSEPAEEIVSTDALALVRFGLRGAADPRIRDTVRVIDEVLKVDLPGGSAWHRYNDDGYGEMVDGTPFTGVGVGRAWPLLSGERAHYELAAGNRDGALRLLSAMESFAGPSGLIPEQVWDSDDIPERELFYGRPSHSAMPLVWAHAEYLKLCRSLQDGRIFDMPRQAAARYLEGGARPYRYHLWRFNHKCRTMPAGKTLRLEVNSPGRVRWSENGWSSYTDTDTRATGLGFHAVDLATEKLPRGASVDFTFFWKDAGRWEGVNFTVTVAGER